MLQLALLLLLAAATSGKPQVRVVGGGVATAHKYPWTLQFRYYNEMCGAVLLSEKYALTAAHCVLYGDQSKMRVLGGMHEDNKTTQYYQESIVKEYFTYYYWGGNSNDIAILELKTPMTLNDGIKTAVLPDADKDYAGENECHIAGWGSSSDGSTMSKFLRAAKVDVLSNTQCHTYFSSLLVRNGHVCSHAKEAAACNGDSGGPLTCTVNNKEVLVGVLSFVPTGCPLDKPSVYTRVSKYLTWIKSKTGL